MGIFLKFIKNFFEKKNQNSKDFLDKQVKWYNDLDSISTFDCIIPTKNLIFCHIQEKLKELIKKIHETIYPFILVYNNNIDDLIGIVYEKDIIYSLVNNNKKDGCDFLFSKLEFSPYTMGINDAIEHMYENSISDLIIVDSKGITLGLLNINSIINFLYGYKKYKLFFDENIQNNSIKIESTILLKHIPEDWQIQEFQECYKSGTRTLGGFLCYYTGEVLSKGMEISIDKLTFKILESNDKFIKTILMTKK
jgi:putative hemolysin